MNIAVLGIGSAGIQSLCHMLTWLPSDWTVTSIHNPNIDILGIGESTNPTFIKAIELGLDFNIHDDTKELDGTLKLGTFYENWREQNFINPLLSGSCAIHFNTFKLKEFALPRLKQKWGNKFIELHGNISNIKDNGAYVSLMLDNSDIKNYDYIIDCRGFPKEFTDYTVLEKSILNHGLIHNIPVDGSSLLHTVHRATPDGWMFKVPLKTRISHGYLFNDTITSIEDAKNNFSKEIGVPVSELDDIEYKFKSFYTNKMKTGRIFKNGNMAVFFEPMFANSLFLYNAANQIIIDSILFDMSEEEANKTFVQYAEDVKDVIYFCYHGGSNYNTEFWKITKDYSTKQLNNSNRFKLIQNKMKKMNRDKQHDETFAWTFTTHNLNILDRNFGYGLFRD
jgi:hypothetical protein